MGLDLQPPFAERVPPYQGMCSCRENEYGQEEMRLLMSTMSRDYAKLVYSNGVGKSGHIGWLSG